MIAGSWPLNPQRRPLLGYVCETPSIVHMTAAADTTDNSMTGAYTSALVGTWVEESAADLGVSEELGDKA